MSTCTHAINIKDGRIVYRTQRTDELVALYRKIDEETVNAIKSGEIGRMEVVNAIMGREYASGSFNWKEFDEKRRELNMRTLDVEFPDIDKPADEALAPDTEGEVMSLSEIKKQANKGKAEDGEESEVKPGRKPRAKKAVEDEPAVDEGSIFS